MISVIPAAEEMGREGLALTIDGIKVRAPVGVTVLEAAQGADIFIPALCHDKDLKPYGACRLCVVEIEGFRGIVSSCTTPATEGMVVHTETPKVMQARRTALELIMANHPADCLTCAKNQQCDLQKVARYVGLEPEHFSQLRRSTQSIPIDQSHPAFNRDPNKCILCAKCVRACQEIACVGAIDLAFRGYAVKVSTFGDKPIRDSICESCGECIARCPTGALMPKRTKLPTRRVKTVCPYCGVGCSLYLGIRGNEIVDVQGDGESPVNKGGFVLKAVLGLTSSTIPEG
jgi:predicted molibdopterin-dependent oxidoreductase YjgC